MMTPEQKARMTQLRDTLRAEPARRFIAERYFSNPKKPEAGCACAIGWAARLLPEELREPVIRELSSNNIDEPIHHLADAPKILGDYYGFAGGQLYNLQNENDLALTPGKRKATVLAHLTRLLERAR